MLRDLMESLDLGDELFWEPARVVPPDPWTGHLPFAFWLAKIVKPSVFVELGTHSGNSYFAFCQSIAANGGGARAFAVDTWQGDAHAGNYGEDVFADVHAFNRAHFLPFSTLLRTTFNDARGYFPDSAAADEGAVSEGLPDKLVDLLHIDGLHSYEAVKADFETWRTALSRRAVVVFHDTNVRERGFGVWRLWQELSAQYPGFEFHHSNGLGVLGVGPEQPEPMRCLFDAARLPGAAAAIRRLFAARGETFQRQVQVMAREAELAAVATEREHLRGELARQTEHLHRQVGDEARRHAEVFSLTTEIMRGKDQTLEAKEAMFRHLNEALQARDAVIHTRDAIIRLRDDALLARDRALNERDAQIRHMGFQQSEQVRVLEDQIRAAAAVRKELEHERARTIWELQTESVRAQERTAALYRGSTSWRITAPLRAALRLILRRAEGPILPPGPRPSEQPPAIGQDVPAVAPAGAESAPQAPAAALSADARATMRAMLATRLDNFLASAATLQLPGAIRPGHADAPDASPVDVSIVLVLFNQAELTYGCLASIVECLSASALAIEVVILDNASTDRTGELLDRIRGAKVVRGEVNLHFLHGVNRAVREAAGRHLLLLNNDAQLLPGAVEAAVRTLDADPAVGAVGGRIILPDGTLQEAGSIVWDDGTCVGYARGCSPTAPEAMFRRDVDYCSGAFLLTPRALFAKLGGFDTRYAPAYYEETDYCLRLWEAGHRVVFDPDIAILHYEFGSAAATGDALALQQRNRRIFAERHATWLRDQHSPSPDNMLGARTARSRAKRVLMIEDRVPKTELGSGYPRSNHILHELSAAGAVVTFFPIFPHRETWPGVRRAIDPAIEVVIDGTAATLRAFLEARRGSFDAILVCRPHNMEALQEAIGPDRSLLDGATVIYDAEAVFARRNQLRDAFDGKTVSPEDARAAIAEEIGLTRIADIVVSVSPAELQLFQNHGVKSVYLLGHALEDEALPTGFAQRADMVFLGAVHDESSPNADSLRWFASEVLPHIRRELGEDFRLKVVGMNRAASITALDGVAFDLVGQVEELGAALATARVMVVPTRYGAGIPHKVHQAAMLGIPMVATTLILDQLGWQDGRDMLAATDPAEFAAACVRLFQDKPLWDQVRSSALERARAECSTARFGTTVREILAAIPDRPRGKARAGTLVGSPASDGEPPFAGRPAAEDYSVAIPFAYPPVQWLRQPRLAVLCHLFHPEMSREMRGYLSQIPFAADLFISTDTEEKRELIAQAFEGWDSAGNRGAVELRVMPNRGRDIAPKLVGFRDVHDRYEYVLHIHSKASHHANFLAPWRGFLLENLVGSPAQVRSVFEAFRHRPDLGMIFPQHFEPVRRWLDWNGNFPVARAMAARMGIDLRPDRAIDFPSGSMFWARTAALRPLLDLHLSFDDFPEEGGQKDDTPAHAIERLYLMSCERAGLRWLKIARPALYTVTGTIVEVDSPEALDRFIVAHGAQLAGANPPARAPELPPMMTLIPPGLAAQLERRQRWHGTDGTEDAA